MCSLENLVGGESVMNPFLRAHCERFAHGCVNSTVWKPFFLDYMLTMGKVPQATLDQIDWDAWYNKPGMPIVKNEFDQSLIKGSNELANQLVAANDKDITADAIKGWDSAQVVILLERVLTLQREALANGEDATAAFGARLGAIDALFHFTASKNSEIRFRWLTLCIRQKMQDRYPAVGAFLREQGRMKFVRPLYRDLYESEGAGREFALALFKEHGKQYHSIAQKMVAKDLQLA